MHTETAYPTTWIEYKIRKEIVTQHTCAHIIPTVIEDLVKMLFQKESQVISSLFPLLTVQIQEEVLTDQIKCIYYTVNPSAEA
jgi:hypothetical protein